ncbi:hypothetical protein C8Q77DRAFT_1085737 [Trametes polyzona]|nr:hypothetical protein C8Q77DRAFT_1085737 [Trametes polyzona]
MMSSITVRCLCICMPRRLSGAELPAEPAHTPHPYAQPTHESPNMRNRKSQVRDKAYHACLRVSDLPPRALSARLRGRATLYVRTSLSPDASRRVPCRRRAQSYTTNHRRQEVIEISSDSEPDVRQAGRRTNLERIELRLTRRATRTTGDTRHVPFDLTREASEGPPRVMIAASSRDLVINSEHGMHSDNNSAALEYTGRNTPSPPPTRYLSTPCERPSLSLGSPWQDARFVRAERAPPWIRIALQDIRTTFPRVSLACDFGRATTARGTLAWYVICLLCDPEQVGFMVSYVLIGVRTDGQTNCTGLRDRAQSKPRSLRTACKESSCVTTDSYGGCSA